MGYMGTLSGVVCGVEKEGMLDLGEYDGLGEDGLGGSGLGVCHTLFLFYYYYFFKLFKLFKCHMHGM